MMGRDQLFALSPTLCLESMEVKKLHLFILARMGKRLCSRRSEGELGPQEDIEWLLMVGRKWFGPTGLRGKMLLWEV